MLYIKFSCHKKETNTDFYTVHGDKASLKQYHIDRDLSSRDDGTILFLTKYTLPGKCMMLRRYKNDSGNWAYTADLNEYNRLRALAKNTKDNREFGYYMDKADAEVNLELPEQLILPGRTSELGISDSPASSDVSNAAEGTETEIVDVTFDATKTDESIDERKPLEVDTQSNEHIDAN